MAILRASSGGLLRTAAGRRAAPPGRSVLAATAATTPRLHVRGVKDDLGGPGGQEPPPEKPSGTDAIRRNW